MCASKRARGCGRQVTLGALPTGGNCWVKTKERDYWRYGEELKAVRRSVEMYCSRAVFPVDPSRQSCRLGCRHTRDGVLSRVTGTLGAGRRELARHLEMHPEQRQR
jgi:hypothetical protein